MQIVNARTAPIRAAEGPERTRQGNAVKIEGTVVAVDVHMRVVGVKYPGRIYVWGGVGGRLISSPQDGAV